MTFKEFFSFRQNKLFWGNVAAMIVVAAGLMYGVLKALDVYTRHGEAVVVPDVKGMGLQEAKALFAERELLFEVADSNYVKTLPAGCILDYNPVAGQRVKKGRTIYLTINTLSVPLQEVPDVADNSSLRQAEASMLASGFKLDSVEYIPGERDWVYGVKYRGRMLSLGEGVPMGATLTLVAGNGKDSLDLLNDSLMMMRDSLIVPQQPATEEEPIIDDSWF